MSNKSLRADVRFLKDFAKNKSFKEKDLVKISDLFLKDGGSWSRIFNDMSVTDIGLLKDTISNYKKSKK